MFTLLLCVLGAIQLMAAGFFLFFGQWLDALKTVLMMSICVYMWLINAWPYEREYGHDTPPAENFRPFGR